MWTVEVRYKIYELKNGLLLETRNHWDEYYPMFTFDFETQEDARLAIAKEEYAPDNLVILPIATKHYE